MIADNEMLSQQVEELMKQKLCAVQAQSADPDQFQETEELKKQIHLITKVCSHSDLKLASFELRRFGDLPALAFSGAQKILLWSV